MSITRKSLWKDFDGEPFLINPHLIVANSPKKGRTMAHARKRSRMPAALRKYWAKHRKNRPKSRSRPRRNYPVPGFVANPRRKRRKRAYGSLRHYARRARHNPPEMTVMGLSIPPLTLTVAGTVGFALPAVLETYIMPMLPASIQGASWAKWLVRGGIVIGGGMLARRFNRAMGTAFLIGGGIYMLLQVVKEFAPGMIPGLSGQPFLGYYPPNRMTRLPGHGMSEYASTRFLGNRASAGTLLNTSDRLSPRGRF
jgi:hypothetical protein